MTLPLVLDKPLAVFDVEATGVDTAHDKIVSLAVTVFHPDGAQFKELWLFNPGRPIPPEATKVHGITDEMVMDKPRFESLAETVHAFIRDCDLCTFNGSNFDLGILWEEFNRAGINWDTKTPRHIDVGNLVKKMEPRSLTASLKFHCGEEHTGAHQADGDVSATVKVLAAMLERQQFYQWLKENTQPHVFDALMRRFNDYSELALMEVPDLAEFSRMDDRIDLAGVIARNAEGEAVYTHKKMRGVRVLDDLGYARWILGNDFSENTKQAVRRIIYPQQELQELTQ